MTTTETMAEFVARLGITMESKPQPNNPNADADTWSKDASHWLCLLSREGAPIMPVPFSQGAAHRRWKKHPDTWSCRHARGAVDADFKRLGYKAGASAMHVRPQIQVDKWILAECTEPTPPDAATVLDCLASDSSSYDNARNFDDWCSEFGYDSDSRKAERTYRICGEQAKALRHFLGNDEYRHLLENVERL